MKIVWADEHNLKQVIALDAEMTGSDRRIEEIKSAVNENRCLVVFLESQLAGFLIYHSHFFYCCFISLLMIKPVLQRKGFASALLEYMEQHSPTEKLFSSTNQSNTAMQKVFQANGFIKSGNIDNLDEGDPEIVYYKRAY
jgi:GNAT superfamily N-acetyltransferase